MSRPIEHSGVVERVGEGVVCVKFVANAACSSCRVREACGMGESKEKTVEVVTADSERYAPGQAVTVSVSRSTGLAAVLLAYVGALVVLIGVILAAIGIFSFGEGAAALTGLAALASYYLVLWLLRDRIDRKIHFTITKQ